MLEQLFGSKTRVKLLRLLISEPGRAFFVREMARSIDVHLHAVRRELATLIRIGLILEVEAGTTPGGDSDLSKKFYKINENSILFAEMASLIAKARIADEQTFFAEMIEAAGKVEMCLLTGIFTGEPAAGTDILIVGDLYERKLSECISRYERDTGLSIRYTTMSLREFTDRRHIMDKFIYGLFEAKHVTLVDELQLGV